MREDDIVAAAIDLGADPPSELGERAQIAPVLQTVEAAQRRAEEGLRMEVEDPMHRRVRTHIAKGVVGRAERVDMHAMRRCQSPRPLVDGTFRATARQVVKERDAHATPVRNGPDTCGHGDAAPAAPAVGGVSAASGASVICAYTTSPTFGPFCHTACTSVPTATALTKCPSSKSFSPTKSAGRCHAPSTGLKV